MTQKIVPHLWFNTEALQAAQFYTSVFENSSITHTSVITNTPSGDCDIVAFTIMGFQFMAISAGPYFTKNPSISFHIRCKSAEEVDMLWSKLIDGGTALMELGEYPFSPRYGWVQDKFGVSWQVILTQEQSAQRIVPVLMFTQHHAGKAEEALELYTSIFPKSTCQVMARYVAGEGPDKEGTVKYAHMTLCGQDFGAMDSAMDHKFSFNEGVSLMVLCEDQAEIDYFWSKLSADPQAEQCGWVKDAYGVSWQITARHLQDLLAKNPAASAAMLKMKKIIIADLQDAGKIAIASTIRAPLTEVWEKYNNPDHVTKWNAASPDWHTPVARNDLRVGGTFTYRMEAKDGSMGFDFSGTYDVVDEHKQLSYTMGDKRHVDAYFSEHNGLTSVRVVFDPETQNSVEMQRNGWQSILDNFKKYVEK